MGETLDMSLSISRWDMVLEILRNQSEINWEAVSEDRRSSDVSPTDLYNTIGYALDLDEVIVEIERQRQMNK